VLVGAVREDDAVFRKGGDEFALLLERCPRERAVEVVDRVLDRLRELAGAADLAVGPSFGVAVADCSRPVDSDELLRRADDAMYEAKGTRVAARGGLSAASAQLAERQCDAAHEDDIAVAQLGGAHAAPVDPRAVRRAVVEDAHGLARADDDRVTPRDRLVLEPQVGTPRAPDARDAAPQAQQPVLVAVLDEQVAPGRGAVVRDGPPPRAVAHAGQRVERRGVGRALGSRESGEHASKARARS
jgi:hypothetical protein